MDFIQTANKQVDKFGAGKHGFSAGNPSGGVPATYVSPTWCDNIQQEIVNVIEGAGIAINPGSQTQLFQAIQAIYAAASGNDYKASVRFTTTGNIVLNGLGTQAGGDWPAALNAGDRVLAKDQAVGNQNGIYVAAAGAWVRAADADQAGELTSGASVEVEEGVAIADSRWVLITDGAITIGTTALLFARKDSGAVNTSQLASGSAVPTANTLVVTLDPSTTDFRSSSNLSGSRVSVTNVAAISLVVPQGASLGMTANQPGRVLVLELNVAGVKEVAIVNEASGLPLDEMGFISTTAISAAATSANVVYSQVARAAVAYRIRMIIDMTQAVPGTYASPMTLVQPMGGQTVLAARTVSGPTVQTRAAGTTYYNIDGRPRLVQVMLEAVTDAAVNMTISVIAPDGTTTKVGTGGYGRAGNGSNGTNTIIAVVPIGWGYVINGTYHTVVEERL